LARGFEWAVTSGVSILIVLAVTLVALRSFRGLARKIENLMIEKAAVQAEGRDPEEVKKRISTLSNIVRAVGVVSIWAISLMIILKKIGLDIGPVIAGAGIVGVAVGFGAQNLVRDVISGFFILLENQIRVGDVATVNGTGGLVESINLRTVVLRDLAGVVHVFPNGDISTLANRTKEWSAMVYDIGVAYKEDTDRVCEVMREVAEGLRQDAEFGEHIIEPLEILGVDAFADSAVVIKARQKTRPIKQWFVGREYLRRLKKAFDEKDIEIPFPHRSIYFGEASKPIEALLKSETSTTT
jgi:small conductance mechanosensitive channel